MGILNILDLTPLRLNRILDYKKQEKIQEFNNNMAFAWEVGRLCAIGVNNPKEFPKKPIVYQEEKEYSREESLKEWKKYISKNKAI